MPPRAATRRAGWRKAVDGGAGLAGPGDPAKVRAGPARARGWTVKKMLYLLIALGLLLAGILVWVRVAPSDPAVWHVDPVAAPDPATPNWARLPAGEITAPTGTLAPRIARVMAAEPRMTLLAGAPESGWTTWVQRSRLMGYPDYISVRVLPAGAGQETVAVLSRSRFGQSDLGVNAARLARLRAALAAGG